MEGSGAEVCTVIHTSIFKRGLGSGVEVWAIHEDGGLFNVDRVPNVGVGSCRGGGGGLSVWLGEVIRGVLRFYSRR